MPNKQMMIMAGLLKPDENTRLAAEPSRHDERSKAVIKELKIDLKAARTTIERLEEELKIARAAIVSLKDELAAGDALIEHIPDDVLIAAVNSRDAKVPAVTGKSVTEKSVTGKSEADEKLEGPPKRTGRPSKHPGKPWEAMGLSQSTWRRRGKPASG